MRGIFVLVTCFLMNCASVATYAYAAQHDMPSVLQDAFVALAE